MKYYISLFNEEKLYDVYPNVKVIEKLSEELDMYEFTLKPLDYELDLDFKKYNGLIPVSLYLNNTLYKKMYLSYYKCVNVSYNPKKYKYVFQCTSPTLLLQRISLPNKLITQPIIDEKRTIYEELTKIMSVYAPNIQIDSRLQIILSVPCPEMQFTKSTLHEVLIGLFAVVNLVPKMTDYNFLSFMSLEGNEQEQIHSLNKIIRIEKENRIDAYADALDFDIENAIINNNLTTTSWLHATSEEAIITTDNAIWELPTDIYEIQKVLITGEIYYKVSTEEGTQEFEISELDITEYVVPKVIYDTKRSSSAPIEDSLKYKRNFLYYEENKIKGAGFNENTWVVGMDSSDAISNVIRLAMEREGLEQPILSTSHDARVKMLKVIYVGETDNSRVKIIKNGIETPINHMISNQDDAYIDLINFGNQKQELINRIGNEIATGQANYKLDNLDIFDYIPYIGDYFEENYIATQREMLLKESNVLINYQLSKDYVLKTGYSGLNQLKRFTSIDTQNTTIRNDLFLYNFKFSFNKNDNDEVGNNTLHIAEKLLENYGNQVNGYDFHLIRTWEKYGIVEQLENNQYFLINAKNTYVADSILSHFQFENNVKIGEYIKKSNGVYTKFPLKYTDDNGEFERIDIYFGQGEQFRNVKDFDIVKKYPLVEMDLETFDSKPIFKYLYKDNREITAITFQFRVLNNKEEDIFVYNNFLKWCGLYSHEATNLKIYKQFYNNKEDFERNKYNEKSILNIGLIDENANFIIDQLNRNIKFENVFTNGEGYYIISLVDKNNNLLLGINIENNGTNIPLNIYLNNY